jgi:hypothetical protein
MISLDHYPPVLLTITLNQVLSFPCNQAFIEYHKHNKIDLQYTEGSTIVGSQVLAS